MRLKVAIVLAVTVVCLVAVMWGLDLQVAREAIAATNWLHVLPMVALYLCAHAARSVRLGLLLGESLPFYRLFAINSIGFLSINVVPLRLGEMVRPYLLWEREGVSFGRCIAAIFTERLLDLCMLLVLLLGLTWVVELPAEGVLVSGIDVVSAGQRIAGTLVGLGMAGALMVVVIGEPVLQLLERIPILGRIGGFSRRFREGLVALLRHPMRALALLGLSMLIWGLTIVAVGVMMAAVPGIPVGLGPAWSTWTITLSGMTAVPTPGFFGSYEAFCTAALWLWQVDADLARTFALVLHLTQFGFTILLGSTFLVLEGLSLRTLVRQALPDEAGDSG